MKRTRSALLALCALGTSALAAPRFVESLPMIVTESQLPEIDILWVIDNSGSMQPHQNAIAAHAQTFISEFVTRANKLDWKMGLLSTDLSDKPYLGFDGAMSSASADPVTLFQDAVGDLGVLGSSKERPYASALGALKAGTFLRSNTPLALIVVTDEEEQSTQSAAEIDAELKTLVPAGVHLYGAFPLSERCGLLSSFNYAGSKHESMVHALKGQTLDLCAVDLGSQIAAAAKSIVSQAAPAYSIKLSRLPRVDTVQVYYLGNEIMPSSWTYDPMSNSVIFTDVSFLTGSNKDFLVTYFDL